MAEQQFHFEGLTRFYETLEKRVAEVDAATAGFVTEGAHAIERQAKINASSGRHQAGTPTPATPGSGPAIISGTLRRSIHVEGPQRLGLGSFSAMVGPSVIYGRRVELEYDYPYLGPAVKFVSNVVLHTLAKKWWGRGWRG